jgi:hypothetical protein
MSSEYPKKYLHSLKLNCKNPFKTSISSSESIKKIQKNCQDLLDKNYDNPKLMEKISCIIQWIIYLSQNENYRIPRLGQVFKLQENYKLLSEEGVSSKIYSSLLLDRLNVIIKKSREKIYMIQNLHEGIITKIFINKLRFMTDGFCFNYATYKKNGYLCLIQERLSFDMMKYVCNLIKQPFHLGHGVMVYNWLMQTIINLEIAQTCGFFTHFDLHGGNIMLRKNINKEPKHLLIHDLHFIFERHEYEPVIIDFGHSVCWNDTGFIGLGEFPEYGFLDFFIPGCDQFKILANYYLVFYKERHKSDNIKVISDLFEYIIFHFYPEQFLKKTPLWTKQDQKWKGNWFYNINYTELAVYTPYELIKFLLKHEDNIYKILKTQKVKFIYQTRKILDKQHSIDQDLLKKCVIDGLCSSFSRWAPIRPMEPCMFPLAINQKNIHDPSLQIDPIFLFHFYERFKTRPILQENPSKALISDMQKFIRDVDGWKLFLNQVYNGLLMIQTDSQNPKLSNFMLNFHHYLGLARWYVCIIGYLHHFH